MSKKKAPASPSFQQNPYGNSNIGFLSNIGQRLSNLDFTGNLSPFQSLVNPNPDATNLALQGAQGFLDPIFRRNNLSIQNQAANAGALQSSTFTDALSQNAQDLNSQYQSIGSQAALQNLYQSQQNLMSLFGTGLSTVGEAAGLGLQAQGQQNQFNLSNYENQYANYLQNQRGGFLGGLMGAAGGYLAGGPLGAIGGGLLGGFGAQGTGQGILGSGAGLAGEAGHSNALGLPNIFSNIGKTPSYVPGSFAFESLRGSQGPRGNAFRNFSLT